MVSPKRMMIKKLLLVILSALLLLPNFFDVELSPRLKYNGTEKFDQNLTYLNSIEKLEAYTDSVAATKNISTTSCDYVCLLESVISQRFYHGFSYFSLNQNWIAALAGNLIKVDYSCKVQPEQIMKYPNAACSQQSLVMMAVLRNKHLSYRYIGFPHHYAMEVLVDNEWCFFDANMEPQITKEQRTLASWGHQNDNLKAYYKFPAVNIDSTMGNGLTATIGPENEIPARNARLFHAVTGFASKTLWLLPLLLIFYRPSFSIRKPFIAFTPQRKIEAYALYA